MSGGNGGTEWRRDMTQHEMRKRICSLWYRVEERHAPNMRWEKESVPSSLFTNPPSARFSAHTRTRARRKLRLSNPYETRRHTAHKDKKIQSTKIKNSNIRSDIHLTEMVSKMIQTDLTSRLNSGLKLSITGWLSYCLLPYLTCIYNLAHKVWLLGCPIAWASSPFTLENVYYTGFAHGSCLTSSSSLKTFTFTKQSQQPLKPVILFAASAQGRSVARKMRICTVK